MSILESTSRINLFLAGTGSGKTFLGGILSLNFVTKFPEVRGAIFARILSEKRLDFQGKFVYDAALILKAEVAVYVQREGNHCAQGQPS